MRLIKLTLSGFKSFADKAEFTFDDAVVGVVGPNGCGKSNIVDAIKWVLGERSSKSLRGKEMIDVIFAGSAGRKPSGMASVVLSFENPVVVGSARETERRRDEVGSEAAAVGVAEERGEAEGEASEVEFVREGPRRRGLPIDADMVEVERRLYRDGTSQYLINSKRARLKDIRDLFLDTGIGADAYSIIEQGKVDAMLLASPQERRTIFEEAAGIAKFKQRRIESQRKLERAQANLALTREQLTNTERRLRMVKGQAAKARRFRELDSELRALRLALAFEHYDDVRERLSGLTSRLTELEGTRASAAELVASLELAKQDAESARYQRTGALRDAQEERQNAAHAREQGEQRRTLLERSLADATDRTAKDRTRREEVANQKRTAEATLADLGQSIGELSESLASGEQRLQATTRERGDQSQRLAEAQSRASQRRSDLGRVEREIAGLEAAIEREAGRAEDCERERARATERSTAIESQRANLRGELEGARAQAEEHATNVGLIEARLAEGVEQERLLSQDRRQLAEATAEAEQAWLRLDSRRAALEDMAQARVGLGEVVRQVLAWRDAGERFTSVVAPLAELIEADPAWADGVESALGADMRALAVPSLESVPSAEELAALPGRATFLPLDLDAGRSTTAPGTAVGGEGEDRDIFHAIDPAWIESGRVVPIRRHARARGGIEAREQNPSLHDGVERALDRLIGRVLLVENLEAARMIRAMVSSRLGRCDAVFLLRDGTTLDAQGRVGVGGTRGAEDEPSGLLRRRLELQSLVEDIRAARVELEARRAQLAQLDAGVAALIERQAALRAGLAAQQRRAISAQGRAEQLEGEAQRLSREAEHLSEQLETLQRKREQIGASHRELSDRQEKLGRLAKELGEQVAAAEAESRQVQVAVDETGERIASARVEVGRLGEQLGAMRREHRRTESLVEDAALQLARLDESLTHAQSAMAEQQAAIAAASAQIEAALATERDVAERLTELQAALQTASEAALSAGERVLTAREHAHRLDRDWHALEVAKRELEVKRENLELRTMEDLRVDLVREYPDYAAMMADSTRGAESAGAGLAVAEVWRVARLDVSVASAEADALKSEIAKLGNVNLDSIEEESQLQGRNEELIRQVADIDDATRKLSELITQLNEASRARFAGVFASIQEHFASADGMFRKLFGGGKAEIRLMPLVKEVETPEGVRKVETGETDLLESGIEVIAKPPGKEPRSINQLSGGEKTLTAVALLLAIFKSKPSCFCVLDEVDAALDEGNVGRYCAVVREFTTHSHFIVITHNKRTMQAADRLYGITMQERGVSTRVSVRLEQVGKDGAIDASATGQREGEPATSPLVASSVGLGRETAAGASRAGGTDEAGDASVSVVATSGPRRKKSLRDALAEMLDESPSAARQPCDPFE